MAVVQEKQTSGRELSPTEKKIAELAKEFARAKAQLRQTGIRADLVNGIKRNASMTDAELYTLAKPFCNMHEQSLRNDPNYIPKKRGAKKQVA